MADTIQNILTLVTLFLLFYEIKSNERQNKSLNKGYLQASPQLDLGSDSATAVSTVQVGGNVVIDPQFPIDALNPVAPLQNLGNLPLKYRVLAFDVWINGALRNPPLNETDHVIGVLFPRQDGIKFMRQGIRFTDTGAPLPFAAITKLTIKVHLKIEYREGKELPSLLDREYSCSFLGNSFNYVITAIRDRW